MDVVKSARFEFCGQGATTVSLRFERHGNSRYRGLPHVPVEIRDLGCGGVPL
jgi:hypothetical protein